MEKSRLAFDSDENTEDGGTEVASEVEGPSAGDPKGNPYDYVDKENQEDGVPLDKNNPDHLARMHEDAKQQEPGHQGILASVIEHEGHSASLHFGPEGYSVRGKGSAGYIKSEPIAKQEHAEEYALEMLRAHAKLTEREILSRTTNLSEEGGMNWGSMSPKEKKKLWESLTERSKRKISACMNKVDGHVDSPGGFCKSLADEVGYQPE